MLLLLPGRGLLKRIGAQLTYWLSPAPLYFTPAQRADGRLLSPAVLLSEKGCDKQTIYFALSPPDIETNDDNVYRDCTDKFVSRFFERMNNVTEFYSYGFSFANVNLPYIRRICEVVNTSNATWYQYTYNGSNYTNILRDCGFDGEINFW